MLILNPVSGSLSTTHYSNKFQLLKDAHGDSYKQKADLVQKVYIFVRVLTDNVKLRENS